MAIELAAGRMMAPFIGVSLYSWTAIIGVVLAGLSLGTYLGGRIVDRFPRSHTLGVLLLLGGLSCLSILALIQGVEERWIDLPISHMAKIVFLIAYIFFLPSCLMGTISPAVVKLTLKDLAATGSTVGRIYAFSTAGSIIGTFATGFVLISWLGTRLMVALIALLLVAMGLTAGELWRKQRAIAVAATLLFLGFGCYLSVRNAFGSPYWKESDYYSIQLNETSYGEGGGAQVRVLILDHLIHSISSLTDPTWLGYTYEKVYSDLVEYMSQTRPSMNVLFIGGGGYTFPRYMENVYPTSSLEVVEIDPEVTRCAYEELGLRQDSRIVTHNMDGRMFFDDGEALKGKYDLILGDAFNDVSIPYHLTTVEFDRQLREALKPNGVYLANIIDNPSRGSFLRPYVNTLSKVFPHVTIATMGRGWLADNRTTLIAVASNEPLKPEEFAGTLAGIRGGKAPSVTIMGEQELAEYMEMGLIPNVTLTDDYAPVDQLISVLFDE
jgi:spermidine synthase